MGIGVQNRPRDGASENAKHQEIERTNEIFLQAGESRVKIIVLSRRGYGCPSDLTMIHLSPGQLTFPQRPPRLCLGTHARGADRHLRELPPGRWQASVRSRAGIAHQEDPGTGPSRYDQPATPLVRASDVPNDSSI